MADFGSVARPYARAIFEIAQEAGELPAWSAALHCVAAVIAQPQAHNWLAEPGRGDAERAQFIQKLCDGIDGAQKLATAEGTALLTLLSENDRLDAAGEIAVQFDDLKAQAEQRIAVKITSATEVGSDLVATLSASLQQRLGRIVDLTLDVDPSLIGGAVIEAEDKVIDASVRSRLQRLAGRLVD